MPETDKSKSKIGLLILLASLVISLAMLLLAAQGTRAALPGGFLSKVNSYPPEKPQETVTGITTPVETSHDHRDRYPYSRYDKHSHTYFNFDANCYRNKDGNRNSHLFRSRQYPFFLNQAEN